MGLYLEGEEWQCTDLQHHSPHVCIIFIRNFKSWLWNLCTYCSTEFGKFRDGEIYHMQKTLFVCFMSIRLQCSLLVFSCFLILFQVEQLQPTQLGHKLVHGSS